MIIRYPYNKRILNSYYRFLKCYVCWGVPMFSLDIGQLADRYTLFRDYGKEVRDLLLKVKFNKVAVNNVLTYTGIIHEDRLRNRFLSYEGSYIDRKWYNDSVTHYKKFYPDINDNVIIKRTLDISNKKKFSPK